jgi:hypothetical protein
VMCTWHKTEIGEIMYLSVSRFRDTLNGTRGFVQSSVARNSEADFKFMAA